MLQNIKWFREITIKDTTIAGSKGTILGELSNEGFNVPPGFIITTNAYFNFLKKNELIEKIEKKIQKTNTEELKKCSQEIKNWIENATLDSFLEKETKIAYMKLGEKKIAFISSTEEDIVAIRSSPTKEKFGEKNYKLNIRGKQELINSIKKCWGELFNLENISIIKEKNIPISTIGNSLIIQKMINSDISGIIYTINPENNDSNQIIIESIYGLSTPLKEKKINPDTHIIEKNTLKQAETNISQQEWMFGKTDFGIEKIPISKNKKNKQKLTDKTINDLARTARQLEQHFKTPQEIDFAIENNKIYIVQTKTFTEKEKKTNQPTETIETQTETQKTTTKTKEKTPNNYELFLKLTKLQHSITPLKDDELVSLTEELSEQLAKHENSSLKTLSSSIKENKYNKEVMKVLLNNILKILEKEKN